MPPHIPSTPTRSATALSDLSDADLGFLRRIAQRFLGCEHLAHDVLQEALLAFTQESVQPTQPLGWLARAMVFRSRHLRRTNRRRMEREHIASQHCRLHGGCDNPLHVAIAHEVGERLTQLRDSLPPEQQEVLNLYECGGRDYQQIASQLGIPIGTVRSRLARARQTLRTATYEPANRRRA